MTRPANDADHRSGSALQRRLLRNMVTSPERESEYRSRGLWNSDTLPGMVSNHARARGDATAVIDRLGERRMTYAELDSDSSRVAAFLVGAGVGPGDVVSVQLPNWYETVAIAVGILKVGAVVNPMLPVYRSKELRHMLGVARAKVLFTPAQYRGFNYVAMVDALRDEIPSLLAHVVVGGDEVRAISFDSILKTSTVKTLGLEVSAADVSELIFTSGTEAEPKAIMHTEQTANFSVRTAYASLEMTPTDVVWMPSPIGHSTGFNYGVRMALYHGLKLVLQDVWDGDQAADTIEAERCTYTLAATTFLRDLVHACEERPRDVSSMRSFGCGGAPVAPELVTRAANQQINVLRLYGSTEVLVATWNRPGSPLDKRTGSDGVALDDVEIVTRDDQGRDVVGTPGEIHTRGPNTSVGFFNDPSRTGATFDDQGWVRSGDLAVMDDDGYLTVVGRKKEIIIRGGLNVAPREVEDVILRLSAVEAVAVVGLPHARLGEIGCACVVLRPAAQLTFRDMIEHLRMSGLASYKWPERLEILPQLPVTTTGKVRKHVLVAGLATSGDS